MIPRSSRLALCCLALLLSLPLLLKGRVPTSKGGGAAFFAAPAGTVTVRLCGDFPHPGLYRLPDGISAVSAIIMTLPSARLPAPVPGSPVEPLRSGDIVTLRLGARQSADFSMGSMGVKERMLLGIPLDPDLMGAEEWCCLPGIGPALAGRIVADRHNNGAFGSLEGVQRVPGIGPGKMRMIRRYF